MILVLFYKDLSNLLLSSRFALVCLNSWRKLGWTLSTNVTLFVGLLSQTKEAFFLFVCLLKYYKWTNFADPKQEYKDAKNVFKVTCCSSLCWFFSVLFLMGILFQLNEIKYAIRERAHQKIQLFLVSGTQNGVRTVNNSLFKLWNQEKLCANWWNKMIFLNGVYINEEQETVLYTDDTWNMEQNRSGSKKPKTKCSFCPLRMASGLTVSSRCLQMFKVCLLSCPEERDIRNDLTLADSIFKGAFISCFGCSTLAQTQALRASWPFWTQTEGPHCSSANKTDNLSLTQNGSIRLCVASFSFSLLPLKAFPTWRLPRRTENQAQIVPGDCSGCYGKRPPAMPGFKTKVISCWGLGVAALFISPWKEWRRPLRILWEWLSATTVSFVWSISAQLCLWQL